MAVQKLFVEGLGHGDESRVESGLRAIHGVLYAAASHADSCAEIEFEDDAVTSAMLQDALRKMGYPSRIVG
jgi:hypothetical protein